MSKILGKIQKIASSEGITIGALERIIGASKGVLSRAISNDTDIQCKWIIEIINNYPRYSAEWLLRGEGPMLRTDSPKADAPKVEASVQTKTGKTKASASAPGTADSAFFMDYIRTKDTMIEQKSQEIASLTGKVARLEAECAFLREQLSRLQG